MSDVSSWRDLLRIMISSAKERERLANEVGVSSVTISRWVTGNFEPRPQSLQRLIHAVPSEYREEFHELVARAYPHMANPATLYEPSELPSEFFRRVLETRCTTSDKQLYWTITQQILEHGVRQLDPERVGISITVVRCTPPGADGKVRSLRENVGIGTPPWEGDLTARALFLGAESLAGHVVSSFHYENVDDLRLRRTFVPAYQGEHEISSIAWPLLMGGRTAGCLLLSSTLPNYYRSDARRLLVADYARLLSLAFLPEQFYPYEMIELRQMPPIEVQRTFFGHFQNRVTELMVEKINAGQRIGREEAELTIWQEIEADLIEYMYTPKKN
jgi:transcriptional regulator with XRE-family HTH domain